jgi:hypothetical protein
MGDVVGFPKNDAWGGEWARIKALKELRQKSVEELRRLWDAFGDDSFCEGYDCADVHLVLNEKGDGVYCAV